MFLTPVLVHAARRRGLDEPPFLYGSVFMSNAASLLLGLDLGPNLAITGSLSALLWLQAARTVGARASIATYSRLGLVLVPLTLAAALLAGG